MVPRYTTGPTGEAPTQTRRNRILVDIHAMKDGGIVLWLTSDRRSGVSNAQLRSCGAHPQLAYGSGLAEFSARLMLRGSHTGWITMDGEPK